MKNILLIEDDPELSANIKDYLEKNDFEVDCCFDGALSIKLLKRSSYDCVILDVNLPGLHGFEIARRFRAFNSDTPILILTAFSELEDKIEGYEAGANDYLTKPFFMKELVLRINALIQRIDQSKAASQTINYGDITIHQGKKEVYRKKELIKLTPREFQILKKLVEAEGEIVTKQDIIADIWGRSFDANTNTIEVYMNFLRNKLDKPFGKKSIKTKIGFGYFFDKNS